VTDLEANRVKYKANPNLHTAMIRRLVIPFIDFNAMGKLTLGKHWRTASVSQRSRFINAYREMLIRSYGKAMLNYSGASIRAGNSVAKKKPGYVKVRTTVTLRGQAPIKANYDVRNTSGKWKAYNVELAGINLITNFRTNFTREASQKGLDALIARLEKSNR
jgi:phospholipid transport system substrate-binding protein